jgi:hypothetical protein
VDEIHVEYMAVVCRGEQMRRLADGGQAAGRGHQVDCHEVGRRDGPVKPGPELLSVSGVKDELDPLVACVHGHGV